MKRIQHGAARAVFLALGLLTAAALASPSPASAQTVLSLKPIAEKSITQLPPGPLYWRVENFPTLAAAQAALGPTSMAAEADGKAWLFTLGAKGGATPGGTLVTEVGPVPRISAGDYLLRVNHATGAPGAKTAVHSHPGAEAFYVIAGRISQKTPNGVNTIEPGTFTPGHGADTPMEVTSAGPSDLSALVMFVVDGKKPFSVPAKMQ